MSKAIYIIVEGRTETDFVKEVLAPYLQNQGIYQVTPIGIETSPGHKGGDVRYNGRYKKHVKRVLRGSQDLVVSSLIDFYGLRSDFPGYQEAIALTDVVEKVRLIERSCAEDINDNRFIPYIQLHEIEGLFFTSMDGFESIDDIPAANLTLLNNIVNQYPNPELINDGPTTAPSKRLIQLIPGYQKPLYGNYIAHINGIDTILEKCPRFSAWVMQLIQKATE